MEQEKKIKVLQMFYAGVLADAVFRMGKEGILDQVTEEKRKEQMSTGQLRASQLGVNNVDEVFTKLSEIFACANWRVEKSDEGFTAEATSCMLCSMAKKLGSASPCRIYCLDAMEGMVKGINPQAGFYVKETLWEGKKCRVDLPVSLK